MRLAQALDGKAVLLTGVTGFVGEALLARVVRDLPGTRVAALVRPKGAHPSRDRLARVMRKPTFGGLDVDALLAERVTVVSGDLNDVPELPPVDIVLHCAGDVSFDPLIQDAFATNVTGTLALLQRVQEMAAATGTRPYYVHVSTAYVSGRRRGEVPEAPVDHTVDWRVEAEAGQRIAARIEDSSRTGPALARFLAAAERDHGRAGPITSAQDAERRRREWVVDQQRAAGGERARSLGWTDAYTFTKAMGERVVEEYAATTGLPTAIVRPSIIESALRQPFPGWIEGYKMADPIIMAYGRGDLPEFPAAPDSIVDIVPVDHVVNALIAVMANPPLDATDAPTAACSTDGPGTRIEKAPVATNLAFYHVTSGHRNPLNFRRLYELVREHFTAHPFDLGERGAARLPRWAFPGSEAVERALVRGETATRLADRALDLAPRSARVRQLSRDLDRQRDRLDFLRRHLDLYRSYTRVELRFVDDNTLALHRALDPADVGPPDPQHPDPQHPDPQHPDPQHPDAQDAVDFAFDTAVVDWTVYIRDIHCPAVTAPVRRLDSMRRRRPAGAQDGSRTALPVADAGEPPVLAVFDMDGTLLPSNVVETFLWLRLVELDGAGRRRELVSLARRVPSWLAAERKDRGAFLRAVYRRYRGADLAALDLLVDEVVAPHVLERVSGAALRRVREHRAAGHRTVLITGAVQSLTRPLAPLFDVIVSVDLEDRADPDGVRRATGFLRRPPLVGEARAAWLEQYAARENVDLSQCYAYADSHSDLPLLRTVGRPTAVSPDVPLFRAARAARWPVEDWATSRGASRWRLPDSTRDSSGAGLPS